MSNLSTETREQTLAALQDPATIAKLKAGILDAQRARKVAKAAKGTAPAKAAKAPAKKVAPAAKKAAPKAAEAPAKAAKPLTSVPDNHVVCWADTGLGSSVGSWELAPFKWEGRWVWSAPGLDDQGRLVPALSNTLCHHPAYAKSGRWMTYSANRADAAAQAQKRMAARGIGPATAAKRTSANLDASRAWAAQNSEARPK